MSSYSFHRRIERRVGAVMLGLALAALLAARAGAAPVTREEALETAYAWLGLSPDAMHEAHGRLAGTVTDVRDALGEPEFYAVDLAPKGYVVVAGDDEVEPVIAFSTTDVFQAVPGHPLFDMLRGDLPSRISRARLARAGMHPKWRMLRAIANEPKVLTQAAPDTAGGPSKSKVSDVRVAPLMKSEWDQLTAYGQPVYNYYTPPYAAGNPNNYLTGCVATMLGQLMRYHQWPETGVGTASYQITVNGASRQRSLRGGNGAGGAYSWGNMPLVASSGMPVDQQQAIGALLADAGVASNMDYESNESGASIKATVLTNVFHYANAAFANASLSTLNIAMQSNLDAGLPVGLGIQGGGEGHAVVTDGYGYNASTLYHHLNMGWSGADNAWYNLPTIVAGGYDFTVVEGALFNIEPTLKGEVISGRITDPNGNGVAGATVTIASGSVVYTETTNAEGIYAAAGISSDTRWTITPGAQSLSFSPAAQSVTTGHSSSNGGVGDKTGLDFTSTPITGAVNVEINAGAVADGAEWRINGGAWEASGAMVSGIPAGTGTLTFRPVKDWVTPEKEPVTVALNRTTSVTVDYTPDYSLTAAPDNALNGQVSANPGPGEFGSYTKGTTVTLTATPSSGHYFAGWVENGVLVSTDATYTSVVNDARNLVAEFPPDSFTGQNTLEYVTSNKTDAIIDVLAGISDSGGTPVVLSVTQPANGTVVLNGDGTLTFTPGKGFHGNSEFSYTIGNGDGGTITRVATIANWFAASAGNYAGLSLADELTNETSGYLKATVTSSGAFSGKLAVAGIGYGIAGAFDRDANYQKVIARPDTSSLYVSLHLDAASEITGTISDGVTASEIEADRVTFNTGNKATEAGRYATLFSGNDAVPGNGYLVVSISSGGKATMAGRLGDGTPVSMGGYLNADGSLPYYAGVYRSGSGAGSIFGTIAFQPDESVQCTGTYAWFRPSSTGNYYSGGFAESGGVTGSLGPATASGAHLQNEEAVSISAELSGGGLSGPIEETGQLLDGGKVVWTSPGAEKLTLSVAASGEVTGSFIDPVSGKKVNVLGIWLRDQQFGGGFFVGEDSAGALTLSSP